MIQLFFILLSEESHCSFRVLQGDPGQDKELTPDMKSCMDRCRNKHACTSVVFTERYDGYDCILSTDRDIPMMHRERNSFLFSKYCPEPGMNLFSNMLITVSLSSLIYVYSLLTFVSENWNITVHPVMCKLNS